MTQNVHQTNHVVYISADGHVQEIYFFRGAGWKHSDLTSRCNGPLAAGIPTGYSYKSNKSQHVVFRGQNGQLYELYYTRANSWTCSSLTERTNAPLSVGNPSGHTYNVYNSQHIMYRSQDGHIHEMYYAPGGGWKQSDLSVRSGAPPAAGDPTSFEYLADNTNHVIYRGVDGHIHEIFFRRGEEWHHASLTERINAPQAVSDPSGHTYNVYNSQHIMYRSQDGHIHELYYVPGGGWQHSDLSARSGAPPAVGNPTSFEYLADNTNHVIYRGVDGHIHEIFFRRGEEWHHASLTERINAPQAAGDPFGYTFDLYNSQHIIYPGVDNHIHELYYMVGGGWNQSNLTGKTGAPSPASDVVGYTYVLE